MSISQSMGPSSIHQHTVHLVFWPKGALIFGHSHISMMNKTMVSTILPIVSGSWIVTALNHNFMNCCYDKQGWFFVATILAIDTNNKFGCCHRSGAEGQVAMFVPWGA